MDVPRVLLVTAVCLGFAGPVAQAQDDDPEVAAELAQAQGLARPWKYVRGFGRVLDLRNPPVIIDRPGLYAIDRNWLIPREAADVTFELIQITADDVTLDLHGFEISADISAPPGATLLVITGRVVEVRNGRLIACCDGAVAVRSTIGSRLHHLSIFSHETMTLGDSASLTDSDLSVRVEVQLGERSNLERNTMLCNRGLHCVRLLGDGSRVTDNKMTLFQGGGIGIVGDRNVVANNVIDAADAVDALQAFVVEGDNNVVRANTVLPGGFGSPIFAISGTANTLDGNIAAPPTPTGRALVGMEFTADGNYYGDNRMAAQVPFALGGTVQTDWGGNVGY